MDAKKIVAVIYGGQSTEHEISCRSAAFLFRHLPQSRFAIAALAVTKEGRMVPQDCGRIQQDDRDVVEIKRHEAPDPVSAAAFERLTGFLGGSDDAAASREVIVFSIMHGTYGEDGCWQGFWELAQVPYVGADVLGSAVAMDKDVAKKLVELAGITIVPYVTVRSGSWQRDHDEVVEEVHAKLGRGPFFVKPANLGSSVGVNQASTDDQLKQALTEAFRFDRKVLVEQAMDVREIEFAVRGDEEAEVEVSFPGEVASSSGFYSYESKYIDANDAQIMIPAELSADQTHYSRQLAGEIYKVLNLSGLARVDLFLDKVTGRFLFNEANTLPGLTSISQYPLLWQHMGDTPESLLTKLIDAALARDQRRQQVQKTLQTQG
jgi:D-alanine-D-alanine ligase